MERGDATGCEEIFLNTYGNMKIFFGKYEDILVSECLLIKCEKWVGGKTYIFSLLSVF